MKKSLNKNPKSKGIKHRKTSGTHKVATSDFGRSELAAGKYPTELGRTASKYPTELGRTAADKYPTGHGRATVGKYSTGFGRTAGKHGYSESSTRLLSPIEISRKVARIFNTEDADIGRLASLYNSSSPAE